MYYDMFGAFLCEDLTHLPARPSATGYAKITALSN